jgi:ribose-phosphate pyrophosphokinase
LSSFGGTFIATGKALLEKGFEEVYLVVTHAEDSIFQKDMFKDDSPIKKVFCADTNISNDWLVWTKAQYKSRIAITPVTELI